MSWRRSLKQEKTMLKNADNHKLAFTFLIFSIHVRNSGGQIEFGIVKGQKTKVFKM
jgi:hypothetical protein